MDSLDKGWCYQTLWWWRRILVEFKWPSFAGSCLCYWKHRYWLTSWDLEHHPSRWRRSVWKQICLEAEKGFHLLVHRSTGKWAASLHKLWCAWVSDQTDIKWREKGEPKYLATISVLPHDRKTSLLSPEQKSQQSKARMDKLLKQRESRPSSQELPYQQAFDLQLPRRTKQEYLYIKAIGNDELKLSILRN